MFAYISNIYYYTSKMSKQTNKKNKNASKHGKTSHKTVNDLKPGCKYSNSKGFRSFN